MASAGIQAVPGGLKVVAGVDAALAFTVVAKFTGFDDHGQADVCTGGL